MSRARDAAVCRNPKCEWNGRVRIIDWPLVGWDVHLRADLRCKCRWALELLPTPQGSTSSQSAPVEPPVAGHSALDLFHPEPGSIIDYWRRFKARVAR